ncbi:Diacylglycerol kinase (ATP) [Saliniradius amylolyticus]|uniref:Diacylglycerol kinase (ATP) n=2 Tax=Saliniradius amylolyticus TaxID=2183582 RepID=A0A2S2E032_9ALTE|nr:Diacylglycerol kinase (ATP) [Saliniradius amylolyticus]
MTRQRHFLIIEPPLNAPQQHRLRQKLVSQLKHDGVSFEHWVTSGDRASDIALLKERQNEVTDVVVLGGDGSLNLVANAFAYTEVAIGVLPCGSGNDFARQWYPKNADLIDVVMSSRCRQIDLGRCNEHYFVNIASIGLSEAVVASQSATRLMGAKHYWLSALKQALIYRSPTVQIDSQEQQHSEPMLMCAFANGRCFGGGMPIAPNASPDDGLLDVCWVSALPVLPRLYHLAKMLIGKHLSSVAVDYWQTRSVNIPTPGLEIEADGDTIGSTPVTIKICPRALWLKAAY